MKTASEIPVSRVRLAIQNRFNPIRNLTPQRLVSALEQFQGGYLDAAARIWETMERRDLLIRNVVNKRKQSVARLPWDVVMVEESREARRHAQYLKDFYNGIEATSALEQDLRGGFSLLVRQMMDAVGRKFAVHEIVWRPGANRDGGLSAEFIQCPLWWFENRTGRLRFLPQDGAIDGLEMEPREWLVTVGDGLMEATSVGYLFKHMPLKDWLAFSEKFGMPGVLGKTSASPESAQWAAMEQAVRDFSSDWAAVCSQSEALELIEVKGGSQNLPFPALVEYCDRQIAALWRGADLSTISQGKEGVGASLQGEESDLILADDAAMITETLNARIDPVVIEYAFGAGTRPLAFVKVQASDATAAEMEFKRKVWLQFMMDGTVSDVMANLTDLKELTSEVGLPSNPEYIDPYLPVVADNGRPVTGGTVTDEEGDIVGGTTVEMAGEKPADEPGLENERSSSGRGRSALAGAETVARRQLRPFAEATREAFKPVAERLQAVWAEKDPAIQRLKLEELLAWIESGAAAKEINGNGRGPVNSDALAEAMLAAMKRRF